MRSADTLIFATATPLVAGAVSLKTVRPAD